MLFDILKHVEPNKLISRERWEKSDNVKEYKSTYREHQILRVRDMIGKI
jgi:hypothetical protein